MNKQEARTYYLGRRKMIEYPMISRSSEAICEQLIHQFRFGGKKVHLFLPIRKNKEVNLSSLIERIWRDGGEVVISRSNFSDSTMTHYLYQKNTPLKENKYGIPEPEGDLEGIDPSILDMVILPLLAYDRNGHRVGYGKGFYDRFLGHTREDCIKVGVSFFEPEARFREIDEHDVAMNFCATPHRVYSFGFEG